MFAAVQTGLVGDNRMVAADVVQVEVGSSPGRVAVVLGNFAVGARRLVASREVVVKSSWKNVLSNSCINEYSDKQIDCCNLVVLNQDYLRRPLFGPGAQNG